MKTLLLLPLSTTTFVNLNKGSERKFKAKWQVTILALDENNNAKELLSYGKTKQLALQSLYANLFYRMNSGELSQVTA